MKTVHEVLVDARNGAAREGSYDVSSFGVWWDSDCGSPRCMLGWCAWESDLRIPADGDGYFLKDEEDERLPALYTEAVETLWRTRPVEPDAGIITPSNGFLGGVEDVAFTLRERCSGHPEREMWMVLDWFDKAIAATAPEPDLSFVGAVEVAA